jgi:hypothetical protein
VNGEGCVGIYIFHFYWLIDRLMSTITSVALHINSFPSFVMYLTLNVLSKAAHGQGLVHCACTDSVHSLGHALISSQPRFNEDRILLDLSHCKCMLHTWADWVCVSECSMQLLIPPHFPYSLYSYTVPG